MTNGDTNLLEGHLLSVWFALERAIQEQELIPSCLNCHTYFCWTRTEYHSREANNTTVVPAFPVRECTGTIKLYIGRQLTIKSWRNKKDKGFYTKYYHLSNIFMRNCYDQACVKVLCRSACLF